MKLNGNFFVQNKLLEAAWQKITKLKNKSKCYKLVRKYPKKLKHSASLKQLKIDHKYFVNIILI